MSKSLLGRSLDNLIQENETHAKVNEEITFINLDQIITSSQQPRKHFDEKKIKELAQSIENYGVIQPIIVSRTSKGFRIIAGERRYQAAKHTTLDQIPCIIRDYNPNRISELALIENIQREDLSSIEEAVAIKALITEFGYKHQEIAEKLGKSRTHITNLIGLLQLPDEVIKLVLSKQISMGHARALSKLKTKTKIQELAKKIIEDKLSVRELEAILRRKEKSNEHKKMVNSIADNLNLSEKNIEISDKAITIKFGNNLELKKFIKEMIKNGS